MHFDEDISSFAYLRGFVVDPLYIQFKDQIVAAFMRICGVEGFLLSVGFEI